MVAESRPVWPEDRVQQGLQMRQEAIWGSDENFFSLVAEPETEPKACAEPYPQPFIIWIVAGRLQLWGQPGLYNETLFTK